LHFWVRIFQAYFTEPFRRVYLVSSFIFVVTEAFIEEFTSYLL
jgi:hypothetical protein